MGTRLAILVWVLLVSTAVGLTTEDWYVDPDAAGTGTGVDWTNAYTSLNAALTAKAADLQAADKAMVFHLRSASGTDDTAAVTIDSTWNMDATRFLTIQQDDAPATGVWDGTKYVLNVTNANAFTVSATYAKLLVKNMQILLTESGTGNVRGFSIAGQTTVSPITIDSCVIQGACTGDGTAYGINMNDAQISLTVYNSVFYNIISTGTPTDNGFQAIADTGGVLNVLNCTIYNCRVGINEATGSAVTIKNCAIQTTADDIATNGGSTIENCATDDGDGTNPVAPAGGSWGNEFNNPGGGDFTLKLGGNCIGSGAVDPGGGLYSDDIIGTARGASWDIGAYEYVAGAGPAKVATPAPADTATDQDINVNIGWAAASGATGYDVYFGTDSTPDETELVAENQADLSYDPGTLAYSTTYYWRIDSKNAAGTTTGDVWSFATMAEPAGGTIGPILQYMRRLRENNQ